MKHADRDMKSLERGRARGTRVMGLALFVALMSASRAAAQGNANDRPPVTLESLQAEIDLLKAANDIQPTIGSSVGTMRVFGRIHLDSWSFPDSTRGINVLENGDPNESPGETMFFRRARIGITGNMGENMYYKSALDFGAPGGQTFKDLFIGWKDVPFFQKIQVGNQKRPYGLDSLNSSNANVFMERPMGVDAVTPDARRLGILAYGVSDDKRWNWRYGIQNPIDIAGSGGIRGEAEQYEVSARLANTAWYESEGRDYGHWAISGAFSNSSADPMTTAANFRSRPEGRTMSRWIDTGPIAGTDHYGFVGLEGVANYGPTQFTAELQGVQLAREGGMGSDLNFWGGYFYVARYLTGEHLPWKRSIGTLANPKPKRDLGPGSWGAWQVAARYSYADYSSEDIQGGLGQSVTLGLNWLMNDNTGIQFNYIYGDISERSVMAGGSTYTGGTFQIFGIRFRMHF